MLKLTQEVFQRSLRAEGRLTDSPDNGLKMYLWGPLWGKGERSVGLTHWRCGRVLKKWKHLSMYVIQSVIDVWQYVDNNFYCNVSIALWQSSATFRLHFGNLLQRFDCTLAIFCNVSIALWQSSSGKIAKVRSKCCNKIVVNILPNVISQ